VRFGPVPLDQAQGRILAHNVMAPDGRRLLRKGRRLDESDLAKIRTIGSSEVWVAQLDAGDVHEDEASAAIAGLLGGSGLETSPPHQARVNLTAARSGVIRVRVNALLGLNRVQGVTVATLPPDRWVEKGSRAATVKILPYALPASAMEAARAEARGGEVVRIEPRLRTEVALILVGAPIAESPRLQSMLEAVRQRVARFEARVGWVDRAPARPRAIGRVLRARLDQGAEVVMVAGETAIMDPDDIIPRGLREGGVLVERYGVPVDPGHLLLLGYADEVPILGAPGCIQGSLPDAVDLLLPRLLVGERLTSTDLVALGAGGLLGSPKRR
jgi:molybdenum cofactor cytidylyltransferase